MKCQNCGSEIEQGNKFCTNCGSPVAAEPTEQKIVNDPNACTSCGHVNQPGHKFCENCGAKLQETTPPAIPSPYSPTANTGSAATAQSNPYSAAAPNSGSSNIPPVIPAMPVIPPVHETPIPPTPQPKIDNVVPQQSEDIVVEEKKGGSKKGLWIGLAIFFAIAAIVLLILLITDKKRSYSYDPYSSYGEETIAVDEPYYAIPAEAEEVVASEAYFSDRFSRVDVYGEWMSTSPVNVDVSLTTYSDGSISATGYAYYNNGDAIFSLRGSGENDGDAMTLNLNEYSSDGDYTGEWRGRVFVCGGRLNYYGHFYDTTGNETCYFDLYANN